MAEIDYIKKIRSKNRLFPKNGHFLKFFGHRFWSCEPIFMIQKPGYAKFQGLSNGVHIVYNFKIFSLGQNGFSPCALPRRPEHPLPEYFIKLKIFLKTRENLLYPLQFSYVLLYSLIFFYIVKKNDNLSWSPGIID